MRGPAGRGTRVLGWCASLSALDLESPWADVRCCRICTQAACLLCQRRNLVGRICMIGITGEVGNRNLPSPIHLPQPISSYCLLISFWTSIVGLFQALPPTIHGVCSNPDSLIAGLCSFFHLLLRTQLMSTLLSPRKDYCLQLTDVLGDKGGFWPLPTDRSGLKQYFIPSSTRINEPRVSRSFALCPIAFHRCPPFYLLSCFTFFSSLSLRMMEVLWLKPWTVKASGTELCPSLFLIHISTRYHNCDRQQHI